LRVLTDKYPNIAMAFWRDTVADASILAKWISVLGRRKAKARLAHLICGMGLRMEQAHLGRRTQFSLPLTQAQLADVLGLTLTRVHSCLTALQREGKIDKQGSEIEVRDLAYLEDCAQFDPRYLLLEHTTAS
jgi:CRP-like cAMP-binding protein